MATLQFTKPLTTSPSANVQEIFSCNQRAHVADPAAAAALTTDLSAWDGATDPTAAEGGQIEADLAALKTAIDANNAAIDSILATLEAFKMHATS